MPKWFKILFISLWLFFPQTVWALQYTYEIYPSDQAIISSSTVPILQLTIRPDESVTLSLYKVWLDDIEYPAQYDSNTGRIWVQFVNPLSTGSHTVKFQYAFQGYVEHTLTSQFEVKDSFDPYQVINKNYYQKQSELAIRHLNEIRHQMGIPIFQKNTALMNAAQAHANYISDKTNPNNITEAVHHETVGLPGYTGRNSSERVTFFGFSGSVAEGIDPGGATVPELGVIRLINSPYHRLSMIDVNYQQIGAGISGNRLENLVLNYGTLQNMIDDRVMVYPYTNQQNVPLAWQAYEVPFPLRFFTIPEGTIVGYPISLHVSSQDILEMRTVQAQLYDSKGQSVSCYKVDSSIDDHSKTHLFLIPVQPLQPNETYSADVTVEKWYRNGQVKTERVQWSFKTANQLKIHLASIELGTSGSELLQVQTNFGDWPDLQFKLLKNGEMIQSMVNQEYQTNQLKKIPAGLYDLIVSSPKLSQKQKVKLQIWQDQLGYKHLKIHT